MTIKCAKFTISIHGLDTDSSALDFLAGWIKEETKAGLLGHQRDRFNFRDKFKKDIDVEIVEMHELPCCGRNPFINQVNSYHDLCGQGGIVKKERDIPHQVDAVVSETIYVLHPDYVTSKNDGDRHFIDAPTLAHLYGVPLDQCLIYDIRQPENIKGFVDNLKFKHLRPRYNGNYR